MRDAAKVLGTVMVILVAGFVAWHTALWVGTTIMNSALTNGPHGDLIETWYQWKVAMPAMLVTFLISFTLIAAGLGKLGEKLFGSPRRARY